MTQNAIDPQLAFYLKHQEAIDAWYQLRERVPRAAHDYFSSLGERFRAELAEELGDDVRVLIRVQDALSKLLLYREGWRDPEREQLRVGVGLEWDRARGTFKNAYVGVWLHRKHPDFSVLDPQLRAECARAPSDGYTLQKDGWWAAWRYVKPAQPQYWEQLERFGDQIIASVESVWNTFTPAIELALEVADASSRKPEGALDEAH